MPRRGVGKIIPRIFSAFIRDELDKMESVDDDGNILSKAEVLARILVNKALGYTEIRGGVEIPHPPERWAIELLYERMEGRTAAAEPEKPLEKTVAERVGKMAALSINALTRASVKKDDSEPLSNEAGTTNPVS